MLGGRSKAARCMTPGAGHRCRAYVKRRPLARLVNVELHSNSSGWAGPSPTALSVMRVGGPIILTTEPRRKGPWCLALGRRCRRGRRGVVCRLDLGASSGRQPATAAGTLDGRPCTCTVGKAVAGAQGPDRRSVRVPGRRRSASLQTRAPGTARQGAGGTPSLSHQIDCRWDLTAQPPTGQPTAGSTPDVTRAPERRREAGISAVPMAGPA